MIKEQPKFASIDALRGYAILAVFICHCVNHLTAPLPDRLQRTLESGRSGVSLFFLVSAVTLLHSMYNRRRVEMHPTRNFFLRRFFRIAPLFYAGIIYYTLMTWLLRPSNDVPTLSAILLTLTFTHGWDPHWFFEHSVVPGAWSIAAEMSFYLLVPWLYARIKGLGPALWGVLATLIVARIFNVILRTWIAPRVPELSGQTLEYYAIFTPINQLPIFLIGFILYFAVRDRLGDAGISRSDAASNPGAALLACGLYFYLALCATNPAELIPYMVFALALVAAGIIFWPSRWVVYPAICGLGRLSFSAYITHFEALRIVDWLVGPMVNGSAWAHLGARVALGLPLTVAISALTYRFIEEPGQAVGRYLIARGEQAVDRSVPASLQVSTAGSSASS